jgi:hypothetical protein
MKTLNTTYVVMATLISLLWLTFTSPAQADINVYEFQLVQNEVTKGNDVDITVRLINTTTGEMMPDAVIFARRIDMAPDGMATMDAPLELLPTIEPGLYRFRTSLVMAGNWQLSLAAKIQGEEGTLESRLILKALP